MNLLFNLINTSIAEGKETSNNFTKKQMTFLSIIDNENCEFYILGSGDKIVDQLLDINEVCNIAIKNEIIDAISDFLELFGKSYFEYDKSIINNLGCNKYIVDEYYLLNFHLAKSSKCSISKYSIHSIKYQLSMNGIPFSKTIKSFNPSSVKRIESSSSINQISSEMINDKRILLPMELVKECLLSFLNAFNTKNICINQSLFKFQDINKKVFNTNINLSIVYPETCLFDLEGSEIKSRKLIENGFLKDFIHSRGDSANQKNIMGDVIMISDYNLFSNEVIDFVFDLEVTSNQFDYLAIWEESFIFYDPNDNNICGTIMIKEKEDYIKYQKNFSIKVLSFFDSISKYDKANQTLPIPEVIIKI